MTHFKCPTVSNKNIKCIIPQSTTITRLSTGTHPSLIVISCDLLSSVLSKHFHLIGSQRKLVNTAHLRRVTSVLPRFLSTDIRFSLTNTMSADDETVNQRLSEEPTMETIRQFFAEKFGLGSSSGSSDEPKPKVIEDLTVDGLTAHWKGKGFKHIITMVGAGISTSAGIPDFRSPGSGLYDNLQKYNLPHPQAIFEMDYFRRNPQPFFALAKELYPGTFKPTPAHYFVRLLHEKGLLVRHYTQNIDTLERIAGIPGEKLVEAHGTFYTNHCLECRDAYTMEWMKEKIFADSVPTCTTCNGVVKPDIVFFGENMPEKFYTMPTKDFKKCDLLIIMGTSLEVQPFASLIDKAKPNCIRLLINRDKVGTGSSSWFTFGPGLMYDSPGNTRDVAYIGNCDDGVYAVADALGWGDELRKLIKSEHARLENPAIPEMPTKVEVAKKEKVDKRKESFTDAVEEDPLYNAFEPKLADEDHPGQVDKAAKKKNSITFRKL